MKLVIVDYLQLITAAHGSERHNSTQIVTEIAVGLKALAQDLGVPVLALSQLSRAIEQQGNRKPRLSDLRESGAIEQAANVVMFLHHRDAPARKAAAPQRYSPGEYAELAAAEDAGPVGGLPRVDLLVEANRGGPTGRVPLMWNARVFRFLDAAG